MLLSFMSFTRSSSVQFKTMSVITKYFPIMSLKIEDIKRQLHTW